MVRIVPLVVGSLRVPRRLFNPRARRADTLLAPTVIWFLEVDGRCWLVDTGPSDPRRAHTNGHPHYNRLPGQAPEERLAALGYSPEAIDVVVLTHLHWDHAYNNHLFTRAQFLVQEREYAFACSPSPDQRSYYEHVSGLPAYLVGTRFTFIRGEERLSENVSIVPLEGHTPGSQGVLVTDAGTRYLIAGDAVPLLENLAADEPVPNGICTDSAAFVRTLGRVMALQAIVLPAHDPVLMEFDGVDLTQSIEKWLERSSPLTAG